MTIKYGLNRCLQFRLVGLLGCLSISLLTSKTQAQQSNIVPDNTLGAESSQVIDNFQGLPIEVITGGATRQINLFHSFQEFNISAGRGAYFFIPSADIQNILARVTGNNPSEILGRLGTLSSSNPNFFLINPNGIVFGKNASLYVQGSFVGTTANGVQLDNQGVFSATNPQAAPLLTVNPSALLFNQINQNAAIQNNATINFNSLTGFNLGLQVPNGQNLVLVGGNVTMDGGLLTAPAGRVEIGAVGGMGSIGLNADGTLNFPADLPRADVSLKNKSIVNILNGNVAVTARNLDILAASRIVAGIASSEPNISAGDISLNITGTLRLAEESLIDNSVFSEGIGNSGNIIITTDSLIATGGSRIIANTNGQGNTGNITIQARNISLDGISPVKQTSSSGIVSAVEERGVGNAGNINITTSNFALTGGAQLDSSTLGQGNAGNLIINASDRFALEGASGEVGSAIFNMVELGGEGKGGNIEINAGSVSISDSAFINASTKGRGDAGNITINARDRISVDGTGQPRLSIFTTVNPEAVGKAGNINITTGSLSFSNDAQLQSSTGSKGNAGNITIDARNTINLDNSTIASRVIGTGEGQGGNINITTDSLSLTQGGQIDASTFGKGDAGNIDINAQDKIIIDGYKRQQIPPNDFGVLPGEYGIPSGIFSSVGQRSTLEQSVGNGGNIEITTGSLVATNGGQLLTDVSNGRGNGGNVIIKARNNVVFDGGVQFTPSNFGASGIASSITGANDVGKGGNIGITADSFSLSNRAQLDARTQGQGDAGNITVNARNFISLTNQVKLISPTLGKGDAANITLNAGDRIYLDNSEIISSVTTNAEGKGGSIFITGRSIDLKNQSFIFVDSFGKGEAGNISVKADTLQLGNQSQISAGTGTTNGGNINLIVDGLLLLRRNSSISATAGLAEGAGNGGNININSTFIIAIPKENSDISANAFEGRGGNVEINSQGIFGIESRTKPTEKSDITASSEQGVSGVININTPDTSSIPNSFTELPPVIDANALIANSCISRGTKRQENSFTITGSGALTTNRPGVLVSNYTTGEVRGVETTYHPWKKGDPIIEPTGVYRLNNGQLLLSRECS
ncbi:filamentous hemagglutinin N-terminal domain-containing protein [Nostoc sp. PCC 9305]|uniref:two-partner secretion domain-containing protein n=1 Tax=Nostoc sp. PCC 9305 TaxID=296636 RepID=UPI0039C75F00